MEEHELSKRERKKLNRQAKLQEDAQAETKKSTSNKLMVVGGIIAVAAFIWFGFLKSPGSETQAPTEQVTVESVSSSDHVKGSESRKLVLIEYGDFQCPACAAYYPITKRLEEEYGDQLTMVFREFPLRSIHKNAQIAAQAAEAAGFQGKFWEMHDKLYENQEAWADNRDPRSMFESYASEIGLDVDKYKTDYDSQEVKDRINADYNSAFSAGVNATPTYFLNGVKLDNPRGYEPFKQIIENKILELGLTQPEESPQETIPDASM